MKFILLTIHSILVSCWVVIRKEKLIEFSFWSRFYFKLNTDLHEDNLYCELLCKLSTSNNKIHKIKNLEFNQFYQYIILIHHIIPSNVWCFFKNFIIISSIEQKWKNCVGKKRVDKRLESYMKIELDSNSHVYHIWKLNFLF